MKNVVLISLLLFISTITFAQKEITPTKNLDAYVGTWVYASNDSIFKITLKRGLVEGQDVIINSIMGGYFLSVKGVPVEDYMEVDTTIPWNYKNETRKFHIIATNAATNLKYVDPDQVGTWFFDARKKHINGKGIQGGRILLLAPDTIRWILNEKRGLGIDDTGEFTPIGFSVPEDVIMIKEK
ncbi:MAG: hypothetical protein LUI85_21090 [Bacteroides sp.]|nr:hypothetical protein [Bacteroides sp.]